MKLLNVEQLSSNHQLAKAVKTQGGKILLPSATQLTPKFIGLLRKQYVTHAFVEGETSRAGEPKISLKDETALFAFSALSGAYAALAARRLIDTSQIKNASRRIILDVVGAVKTGSIRLANIYAMDDFRHLHALNVATITAFLALKHHYYAGQIEDFTTAALLHDLFLKKAEDDQDWQHSMIAKNYLKDMREYGVRTYMSVAMHHEKFDGTGPGLYAGERIVDGARMIAIGDAIDSLMFGGGEFQRVPLSSVLRELDGLAGTALDPAFVATIRESLFLGL